MSEFTVRKVLCVDVVPVKGSTKLECKWETITIDGRRTNRTCIWKGVTGVVGNLYTIEATGDDQVRPATLRYVAVWPDDGDRMEMQQRARANKTAHDAERAQASSERASQKLMHEQLAPLRALYRRMLPDQRRALLANVIFEMTRLGD